LCAAGSLLALSAARSLSGSSPAFLLLCAGLFRATLLFRAPDLSDDVTRYAWDARVAQAGISPYAYAPAHPAVSRLAPELSERIPHADARTVYPPVAQAAFRAALAFGRGPMPFQALAALADLSIVALILALGGPSAGFAAALYAFHPLAIFESAGQGHLDSLGVALLLASLVYLKREQPVRAGAALALSVLTKYVSGFAAIPLLRRGGLQLTAAAITVGGTIWLASVRGGVLPIGGLSHYAHRWEFNSFGYPALTQIFERLDLPAYAKHAFSNLKGWLGHPDWMQTLFPFFYAEFFARAALAITLCAVVLVVGWRVRQVEAAVFASLGALLLASPTLQPWYLLWILPFAARRREPAFLYLSFAVPMSYALLYPVPWLPARLVSLLEYGPFLLLLGVTLFRAAARRKSAA
jgi:Glycosyltransferase family 87